MHNQEIPADRWIPFFNELSKRHQGEHVTVELVGRDLPQKHLEQDQSLLGITMDSPSGSCKIDVMMGEPYAANMSHEIAHPIHVRLSRSDAGRDEAVEIESDSGPWTVVRFQPDAQPPH